MKNELIELINELKEVRKETNLFVSDSELLDVVSRIYISQSISFSKKEYSNNSKLNNEFKNKDAPASEKQIWRLKKEGIQIKEGLTKLEANKLISAIKK